MRFNTEAVPANSLCTGCPTAAKVILLYYSISFMVPSDVHGPLSSLPFRSAAADGLDESFSVRCGLGRSSRSFKRVAANSSASLQPNAAVCNILFSKKACLEMQRLFTALLFGLAGGERRRWWKRFSPLSLTKKRKVFSWEKQTERAAGPMLTWGDGRWEKERIGRVLQFVQSFLVRLKDFGKKWILFCKIHISYSCIHQPAGGAVAHCATPTSYYLSFFLMMLVNFSFSLSFLSLYSHHLLVSGTV